MKKILSILLMLSMLLTITVFADNEISIQLDGKEFEIDVSPIIENDCVLVPVRSIFEALGAKVEWNGENKTVMAQKDETSILITINSASMEKKQRRNG